MEEAVAWLRFGEEQNCRQEHNPYRCLFPIRGEGLHTLRAGSEEAIRLLLQEKSEHPEDWKARWLLNLAYMTVGDYPAKVPVDWLISPAKLESDYPLPRFPDIARKLGLDLNDLAGSVIMEDMGSLLAAIR